MSAKVNEPVSLTSRDKPILPLWLLSFIILLPAIETYVAVTIKFYPPVSYPILKGLSIIAPIVIWRKRSWSFSLLLQRMGVIKTRCMLGIGSGLIIFGFIIAGYYAYIGQFLDPEPVLEQISKLKLSTPFAFWATAVFISLANSAYEEFFWRGFVFDELRMRLKGTNVIIVGALLFGIHHVFALFPMFPPGFATLFTAGTMAGGAIWSWMRIKGFSILDCYISHIFADMAVFALGWDLLVKASAG